MLCRTSPIVIRGSLIDIIQNGNVEGCYQCQHSDKNGFPLPSIPNGVRDIEDSSGEKNDERGEQEGEVSLIVEVPLHGDESQNGDGQEPVEHQKKTLVPVIEPGRARSDQHRKWEKDDRLIL